MSKPEAKICWYCKHATMVPDKRGYKCTSCGATDSLVPELTNPGIVGSEINVAGRLKGSPGARLTRAKLSGRVHDK